MMSHVLATSWTCWRITAPLQLTARTLVAPDDARPILIVITPPTPRKDVFGVYRESSFWKEQRKKSFDVCLEQHFVALNQETNIFGVIY